MSSLSGDDSDDEWEVPQSLSGSRGRLENATNTFREIEKEVHKLPFGAQKGKDLAEHAREAFVAGLPMLSRGNQELTEIQEQLAENKKDFDGLCASYEESDLSQAIGEQAEMRTESAITEQDNKHRNKRLQSSLADKALYEELASRFENLQPAHEELRSENEDLRTRLEEARRVIRRQDDMLIEKDNQLNDMEESRQQSPSVPALKRQIQHLEHQDALKTGHTKEAKKSVIESRRLEGLSSDDPWDTIIRAMEAADISREDFHHTECDCLKWDAARDLRNERKALEERRTEELENLRAEHRDALEDVERIHEQGLENAQEELQKLHDAKEAEIASLRERLQKLKAEQGGDQAGPSQRPVGRVATLSELFAVSRPKSPSSTLQDYSDFGEVWSIIETTANDGVDIPPEGSQIFGEHEAATPQVEQSIARGLQKGKSRALRDEETEAGQPFRPAIFDSFGSIMGDGPEELDSYEPLLVQRSDQVQDQTEATASAQAPILQGPSTHVIPAQAVPGVGTGNPAQALITIRAILQGGDDNLSADQRARLLRGLFLIDWNISADESAILDMMLGRIFSKGKPLKGKIMSIDPYAYGTFGENPPFPRSFLWASILGGIKGPGGSTMTSRSCPCCKRDKSDVFCVWAVPVPGVQRSLPERNAMGVMLRRYGSGKGATLDDWEFP